MTEALPSTQLNMLCELESDINFFWNSIQMENYKIFEIRVILRWLLSNTDLGSLELTVSSSVKLYFFNLRLFKKLSATSQILLVDYPIETHGINMKYFDVVIIMAIKISFW